jgi:hypothetical protein
MCLCSRRSIVDLLPNFERMLSRLHLLPHCSTAETPRWPKLKVGRGHTRCPSANHGAGPRCRQVGSTSFLAGTPVESETNRDCCP